MASYCTVYLLLFYTGGFAYGYANYELKTIVIMVPNSSDWLIHFLRLYHYQTLRKPNRQPYKY